MHVPTIGLGFASSLHLSTKKTSVSHMAQRSHVPKFGNWEEDSVPYTVYFENARKGKASGRRMNPNDPEDNPEIFKALAGTLDSHKKLGQKVEQSSLEHVNQKHHGHRGKPGRKKGLKGSNISFSSSISSVPPKHQTDQSPPSTKLPWLPQHRRVASIPKFGAWDATDPTSGEGFTVIFNKVKQAKHARAITLPSLTQHPSQRKNSKKKLKCWPHLASKVHKFLQIRCCFTTGSKSNPDVF